MLFGDARGHGLRLTWHPEAIVFVLSLWDGETCMGTVHLDPGQAAQLVAVLSERVAEFVADASTAQTLGEVPDAIGL